jgi:hypothetical protein
LLMRKQRLRKSNKPRYVLIVDHMEGLSSRLMRIVMFITAPRTQTNFKKRMANI